LHVFVNGIVWFVWIGLHVDITKYFSLTAHYTSIHLSSPTAHSPSVITLAFSSSNSLSYFFNIYFSLTFVITYIYIL